MNRILVFCICVSVILLTLGCYPGKYLQKRRPRPELYRRTVTFQLSAPYASQVNLYGNFPFNDFCGTRSFKARFDQKIHALVKDNTGIWKIELDLPKGRFYYHFVVDGIHHMLDPSNPERVRMNGLDYSLLIIP